MRKCKRCGENKRLSEFYINKGKLLYTCKLCRLDSSKKNYTQYKKYFFFIYGGKCACCGESEEIFLTIEHINGQAGKKRESSYKAYKRATDNYDPDEYRILCHNCNHASRIGICPHKRIKQDEL